MYRRSARIRNEIDSLSTKVELLSKVSGRLCHGSLSIATHLGTGTSNSIGMLSKGSKKWVQKYSGHLQVGKTSSKLQNKIFAYCIT